MQHVQTYQQFHPIYQLKSAPPAHPLAYLNRVSYPSSILYHPQMDQPCHYSKLHISINHLPAATLPCFTESLSQILAKLFNANLSECQPNQLLVHHGRAINPLSGVLFTWMHLYMISMPIKLSSIKLNID